MVAKLSRILTAAFCASACLIGGAKSGQAASTTIRVWDPWPYYSKVFDKLKDEFHKTHPDINVEVSGMQESAYRAAVKSALAAGTGPDVVTTVPGRTGMNFFADSGSLVDLSPYYQKYHWAEHYPKWVLDAVSYTTKSGKKGKWVVPTHIASTYLFYDPDLFKKRGWDVPQTLSDFLSYCKKAKAAGLIPLAFGDGEGGWMGVEYMSYILNQSAGDGAIDGLVNGKGSWSAPDVVKGVGVLKQLNDAGCFQPGVVSTNEQTALALWIAGRAGMVYDGDWTFATVEKENPALYARMRLLPGQKINASAAWKPTSALGDSLAITSFSKNKDAAAEWLAFMASKEGQSIWLTDAKRIVAWTDLNTKENGASSAQIEDVSLLKVGTAVDLSYPLWPQTYSALETAFQNVLNGTQSPQQAMDAVQKVDAQQWQVQH